MQIKVGIIGAGAIATDHCRNIAGYPDVCVAARRRNGEAFTGFLMRARAFLKKRGLRMAMHVNARMFHLDDRTSHSYFPPNFEYQWEKWVREMADEVYLKDMHHERESHAEEFVDMVTRVAVECRKPVFYISSRSPWWGKEHGLAGLEREIDLVLDDDRIAGYDLYEAANMTRMNPDGRIEGTLEKSPAY